MHLTSYEKFRCFSEHYLSGKERLKLLEVGSKSYKGQRSYRDFMKKSWVYVGLDIEDGPNVHIVPKNPFVWPEIEDETFDVCISGQTFEHNPFFWITLAEISRVINQNGLVFIVVPGGGACPQISLGLLAILPGFLDCINSILWIRASRALF